MGRHDAPDFSRVCKTRFWDQLQRRPLSLMSDERLEKARHPFGGQTLRAFHTRGFRRVWMGGMIWYSARWMETTVLAWQVLVMTDSAFQVTLVGFYRMAPMFFFGLFSGLVADRFDRRRVILFAQLWSGVMAATRRVRGKLISLHTRPFHSR